MSSPQKTFCFVLHIIGLSTRTYPATTTYLPSTVSASRLRVLNATLALREPYGITSLAVRPISAASLVMCFGCCEREITMSLRNRMKMWIFIQSFVWGIRIQYLGNWIRIPYLVFRYFFLHRMDVLDRAKRISVWNPKYKGVDGMGIFRENYNRELKTLSSTACIANTNKSVKLELFKVSWRRSRTNHKYIKNGIGSLIKWHKKVLNTYIYFLMINNAFIGIQ